MASLLDLAQARLGGLLAPQRPSMAGLLGGRQPTGTLAGALQGYTPPQMTAMTNPQVMDYARKVAQSAQQNLQTQMSDLDKALVMDQGGINVGDRQALARLMEQVPGLMGSMNVNNFPNRGKDFIQDSAENLVTQLKKLGFNATVDHSGSKAGASSYVTISDPITGRYIKDPIRFSGHSKGAYQSQFVNEINDPIEDIPKVIEQALAMRQLGESELMKKNRLANETYEILIKEDLKPKQIYKKINESSVEELQKIVNAKKVEGLLD